MKVAELREMLEEMDDDADIYLAEQPAWPFKYDIKGIWQNEETGDVFVVEGHQFEYLCEDDARAFSECCSW